VLYSILSIINMLIFSLSLSFSLPPTNIFFLSDDEIDNTPYYYWMFMLLNVIISVINLIISLNTAFHEAGELITNRWKILMYNLRNSLIIDIIISFFLVYHLQYLDNKVETASPLSLVFVLKVKDILSTLEKMEENFYQNDNIEPVLALGKLITKIVFLTHLIACIWYRIGSDETKLETWIRKINIQEKSWTAKYIYSLYWSLTTTATVGYGDITPQNEIEVVITMIAMLAGCAMFGYSLNKIGNILENMNKRNFEFR
jgi:hypothetical protein